MQIDLHPSFYADILDTRPPAMIIANDARRAEEAEIAAAAAGWRVTGKFAVVDAFDRVRQRPDGGLVMIEIDENGGAAEDRLLAQLSLQAADSGQPLVATFPVATLDRVIAEVDAPYATLLCNPSRAERVAALALASRFKPLVFMNERENVIEAVRLQALADEVGRIARALTGLSEEVGGSPEAVSDGLIGYRAGPTPDFTAARHEAVRAEDVRLMIRLRRQRDALFGADLFADPAWDMMLDLLAARIERLRVAVSSLCIASAVPPTTALRWIKTLTEIGVFRRVADPTDGRRIFIELSDDAAKSVLNFVGEAKRARADQIRAKRRLHRAGKWTPAHALRAASVQS